MKRGQGLGNMTKLVLELNMNTKRREQYEWVRRREK